MKKGLLLAALLGIPGGLLLAVTLGFADLIAKAWTGVGQVDALVPAISAAVLGVYRPLTLSDFAHAIFVSRALAAVANAESSFDGAVGDTDATLAPSGPSISPWQIERANAEAAGWYSPPAGSTAGDDADRAAYAALDTTGIAIFAFAWRAARYFKDNVDSLANEDLTTALRVWNGGPSFNSSKAGYNGETIAQITTDYANKSSSLIADWSTTA
jgi:hypothetical protein